MRPPPAILDRVVASLDGAAPGWTFNGYEAVRADWQVKVWYANQLYGLKIEVMGARYGEPAECFPSLREWRRRLYRAVNMAAERQAMAFFDARRSPAEIADVEQRARERL